MADEGKTKAPREEDPAEASRARNRTVMLTPDITGQVRARLQQELGGNEGDFVTPTTSQVRPPQRPVPEAPQAQAPATTPVAKQIPKTPLVGFLVSFDSGPTGEYYELRTGRMIITSEQGATGNTLVINHDTVSPMHAILRVSQSGEIQVLDQLSEHGTAIRRFGTNEDESLSGDKSALEHGDIVRFGQRSFVVCVIHKGEE